MFAGTDPGGTNVDSGNFMRIEPEGSSFQQGNWVLAEMEGPGCITRIWVTGKDSNNKGPRLAGRIQIFVDRRDRPAVDLPMEQFFGQSAPFIPPLATPTSGGWISYVPIPFSSYCKVLVTDHGDGYAHRVNGLGQAIPHLYHQVCWRKVPAGTQVEPFALPLTQKRRSLLKKCAEALQASDEPDLPAAHEYQPHEKLEIFRQDGPGVLRRIALVCDRPEDLWISIWWDGEAAAAVEAPCLAFSGAGIEPALFESAAFQHKGAVYTCRFPMPFERGARVVLENRSERRLQAKALVDGESALPGPLRFHAHYLDREIEAGAPDIELLNSSSGPGQFVGCALTLPHAFLEGNESFIVDGARAAWTGTGTEDYFNGGWYFCFGPYDHPFSGCTSKGEYISAYRLHILDAVPFAKTISFRMQHGGGNEIAGRARGVVYWYESAR